MDMLQLEVKRCVKCGLHSTRRHTVFGHGNINADIVFVGEAPGQTEDETGLPFQGASGKLLNNVLKAMELDRKDVYICNVVKCRPPNNRNPEATEIKACEGWFKSQLKKLPNAKVIVGLGTFAARALTGDAASITTMRSKKYKYNGIPVVPTYHPAYLLRNPAAKPETWADMQKVMELIDGSSNKKDEQ